MVVIAHPPVNQRLEAFGTAPPAFGGLPAWRRHVVLQEFVDGPAMVRDPGGHRRRPLHPLGACEAAMDGTEVVDRPDQVHAVLQRPLLPRQAPGATRQACQAGAERAIEPFDIGRIAHATAGGGPQQLQHGLPMPADQAAHHPDGATTVLDDLDDVEARPGHQAWRTPLPAPLLGAEDAREGRRITGQAIADQQQGRNNGTAPNQLGQPHDQRQIPLRTDGAAQPQARADHERHRHPEDAALRLDPDLVGLHLLQVARLFDELLLEGLCVLARCGDPRPNPCAPAGQRRPQSPQSDSHGQPT
jgi:hypothetical protein